LDSIATSGGFDLADFAKRWQAFCDGYTGYFDQATLGTLSGFSKGLGPEKAGSLSNDLAGAARVAPIVLAHLSDPDRMISAARAQTEMTHRDPNVVDSAAFFARSALFILQGQTPIQALEQAAQAKYTKLPVKKWLKKGKEKASSNSVQALYAFGLSCHAPEAFPGVIQLVCRYQDDLPEALIQCVMAGGDSAGRAMLVGLLLGAWNGLDVLPQQWVNAMEEKARIETLIEQIAG
jgi:ADP-ribosylglycohydrolase